jgi:hypothetical protein
LGWYKTVPCLFFVVLVQELFPIVFHVSLLEDVIHPAHRNIVQNFQNRGDPEGFFSVFIADVLKLSKPISIK